MCNIRNMHEDAAGKEQHQQAEKNIYDEVWKKQRMNQLNTNYQKKINEGLRSYSSICERFHPIGSLPYQMIGICW